MMEPGADTEGIRVGEFVGRLFGKKLEPAELLRYGHFRGWLEDSDQRHPEALLNRQTAARIIHLYLLLDRGLEDLSDISAATKLRDLYTCRACANHIAQVYCRGIMDAKKEEPDSSDSPLLLFDHLALVSKTEASDIISKLEKIL